LDTIESKHRNDCKRCLCSAVGIDGGNRIIGDLSNIEYRSMYCAIIEKKKIWLPQYAIDEHFYAHLKSENIIVL